LVIYPLVLYFFLLKARSSNVVPGNTTVIKWAWLRLRVTSQKDKCPVLLYHPIVLTSKFLNFDLSQNKLLECKPIFVREFSPSRLISQLI
jgi:hypothetical protein